MKTLFLFTILSPSLLSFQKVDLNHADLKQIAVLDGISLEMASKIIDYRNVHGNLKGPNDLLRVPGLTEKKIAKIKNAITFSDDPRQRKTTHVPIKGIEPSMIPLIELEKIALTEAHLSTKEPVSWLRQSRQSALLPKLGISLDIGHTVTRSGLGQNNSAQRFSSRNGNDVGVSLEATFDLPRLVFNESMLQIEKLLLAKQENKEKLLASLHRHYFDYFKTYDLLLTTKNSIDISSIRSDLIKTQALLDSLTNQAFSRKLKELGKTV